MFDAFVPFLLVLLAIYLWQVSLRAKERARHFAMGLCGEAGVQLLDQTVSLQRLRIRRGGDGRLHWLRRYRFELSTNGSDRHHGSLDVMQDRLLAHSLPLLNASGLQANTLHAVVPDSGSTVIAFPRRPTVH
jgi:hypothetical protein